MTTILGLFGHVVALVALGLGVAGLIGLLRARTLIARQLAWAPASLLSAFYYFATGHFLIAAGIGLFTSAVCQIVLAVKGPDDEAKLAKPIIEIVICIVYFLLIGGLGSLIQFAIALGVLALIVRILAGIAGRAVFGSGLGTAQPEQAALAESSQGEDHFTTTHAQVGEHAQKIWKKHGHHVTGAPLRILGLISRHLIHHDGGGSSGGPDIHMGHS
jgi:hypothetical protein